MITAAHTFALNGSFNIVCRQPPTLKSRDIISTSNLTKMGNYDEIGFKIDVSTSGWEKKSKKAYVGEITTTMTRKKGMTVIKVGFRTGITNGEIVSIQNTVKGIVDFGVKSDSTELFSNKGNSVSAIVTKLANGTIAFACFLRGHLLNKTAIAISQNKIAYSMDFSPHLT